MPGLAGRISEEADHLPFDVAPRFSAAGMDADNLIAAIKQAQSVNFDFSVEGQIKLVKSGVNGKVLTAMRERANAQALGQKSPAAPKK